MPMHDPTPARFADGEDAAPLVAQPAAPRQMTAAKLRAWVREARPRARMIYATGAFVDQHAPKSLIEAVRELHAAGWLRMHLSRPVQGEPIHYLAVRTEKPVLSGSVI